MSPEDVRAVFNQLAVLSSEMQMIKGWLSALTGSMILIAIGAVGSLLYRNGKGKS